MHERPSNDTTRVVAITGAAGSIGGHMARRFAADGWRLALLDRPHNQGELREGFPGAFTVAADLADAGDADQAVRGALEHYGRIDALLNVVGGFGMQSATAATDEDLERQLALNLRTAFHVTRAALPGMLERGNGFVLGMGAVTALRGRARMPTYGAAKSAVVGYFRSVRAEVEPKGVGVSLLFPMGTVDTPDNRRAMPDADPSTWIDPVELAAAAAFLADRTARGRVPELMVYAAG